ncbi:hypothetical protein HPB51_012241 [Rhipicephalus microplus]|uniref:Uncharacterized protein n=1 Tax=Rhipicephalus microplus TaxID=6941 RepID=A0A9J6EA02_RHIMP|nr:hypothetical protein HPB51_012241 [Rhipicephalus microplus]
MDKFSEDVMAHWAECTAAENQTCQIVENLSILNKLLRGSMRELRERPGASGQLHLEDTTVTGPTIQNFDTLQLPEYPELLGRGDEEATGIFAGVISSNKVLRSLTIWTLDYIQPGIASAYDCWIPALIKNETLEKLEIPYQIFEPPQRARLFHALLSKENLNVHIQNWVDRHPDLSFVCAELKSGGLREKVSIGYYKFEHEIEFLQCKAFSEVHFSWPNDHTVAALHVLPSCRHITSINIRINRANVAVSSAFAEFLKSSTALRKLNLSAGLDPPLETDGDTRWWSLLHKALRRNSSLRDLSITLYGMSVQEMEALADSVGRSTSIRWVHVQPRPITNASAFVRRFSKDIERNHTLLTLICEGHIDTVVAEHWYVVQETTRRNSGIVARAARLQKAALLDR